MNAVTRFTALSPAALSPAALVPTALLRAALLPAAFLAAAAFWPAREAAAMVRPAPAATAPSSGASGPAQSGAPAAEALVWNFEVRLDGKPIGTHRFVLQGPETAREVLSTARMDVKLLGLTVYRYRHDAQERWRGDCLDELSSRTDDDGKALFADWQAPAGARPCLMSYAYWHPALVRQQRVLNPQTGEVDRLRAERLPDGTIAVAGKEITAARWRLTAVSNKGQEQITLWRDGDNGRWVGLDAQVKGGRVLTYRLP